MAVYKITNVDDGRTFRVDDAYIDGTIEDFVASKVTSYGVDPLVEVLETDEEVAQREVRLQIQEAHDVALRYIESNFADAAGMLKIDRISRAYPSNSRLQSMVVACEQWADSIWNHYREYKESVLAASPIEFDVRSYGPAPHGFFEIIDAAIG